MKTTRHEKKKRGDAKLHTEIRSNGTVKERMDLYGECCWTCGNTACFLSQINGQPPHDARQGKECLAWISMEKE